MFSLLKHTLKNVGSWYIAETSGGIKLVFRKKKIHKTEQQQQRNKILPETKETKKLNSRSLFHFIEKTKGKTEK